MSGKYKFYYQCSDCGKEYSAEDVRYLCPDCAAGNMHNQPPKGVLKTLYHFDELRKGEVDFDQLKAKEYLDLLPVENVDSLPPLKVGKTPLYRIDNQDDSQNPTFSFKDRASYVVSAYAKEHGLPLIIAAIILVPESAPLAKLTQIMMYGAQIVPVKGTYDDAFDLSVKATEAYGWYNRNTAFNPLTIEGKKTVSFELFDQLGGQIPHRIFVPAVQSEGSDNLVRNLDNERFEIHPSRTVADSISVDIPRNFYMARGFLKKYQGETLTVSDDKILEASSLLAKNTGIFSEPAAATAFAGFLSYKNSGKLQDGSENVVLLTGSGLKDIKTVSQKLEMPAAIESNLNELKKLLG